jgi:hypothetical protein
MLGASCSPCCGPPPCTSQSIADFYNLAVSANVVLEVAGSSDERAGATITLGTYNLIVPGGGPLGSQVTFIYSPTISPAGTLELALSPSESTLQQVGPLSLHFAFVRYRYVNQGLNVILDLLMQPSFFANVQTVAWPGSSCPVEVRFRIFQNYFTYRHTTASLLGPALTNPNGMGGCIYDMWLTDYANYLFENAASQPPAHLGGFDYALPNNLTQVPTQPGSRDYWRNDQQGPLTLSGDSSEVVLTGARSQRSTIDLPRFVDDSSGGQWFSNIAVTHIPEPGVNCGWSISGSASGKRFAAVNMFGFNAGQHLVTAAEDAAHSDVTPTVRLSWE